MQRIIWVSLALILLVSCAGNRQALESAGSKPEIQASLDGHRWALDNVYKDGTVLSTSSNRAFIRFDVAKRGAGGNGSCNSFGSSLYVTGDSIGITNIFSTKMFCEEVLDIENNFLELLAKANRFEIRGERLSLFRDGKMLLAFSKDETGSKQVIGNGN